MKQTLEIELPEEDFWGGFELPPVLTLRGKARRSQERQIIIAALQAVEPKAPTKTNLQRLSRLRRKKFLAVLRYLVDCGVVLKLRDGVKGDPHRYRLTQAYRPKA